MKTPLTRLAALLAFTVTAAHAGTFSTSAWTDDASTGIASGRTLWAYHLGATAAATVNGVSVTGLAGPTVSNADFDLTGTTGIFNADTNNVTGTGSSVMAHDFVYDGNPAIVTVKGLTVGRNYVVSFFSVGWDADGGDVDYRNVTFGSGADSQLVKQDQFGDDNGIRVDYAFTATAITRAITIAVANGNGATFHLYGLALQQPPFVSNTADSGAGSLRQALIDAAAIPGADTVTFDAALNGATIPLSSEIVITDTDGVTVDTTSLPGGVTISGNNATRIFYVGSGGMLGLKGLMLTGGNGVGTASSGNGGAIMVTAGTLEVALCTFTANSTSGNGSGGAIYNYQAGNVTLDRCTLSQNSALLQKGGAIFNDINCSTALTHCTVFGNAAADQGGGIYLLVSTLTLANSIVAGNTAGIGGPDIQTVIAINATGVNFIGDPAGSGLTANPTILTGDPLLAPLVGNGGPTKTMVPLPGSPAIDAVTAGNEIPSLTTDQRGFPRNLDGDGTGGAAPDIGAVELSRVVVTTAVDQLDVPTGPQTSLREATRDGTDLVVFDAALSGQTATLTTSLGGEIVVGKGVIIDASGLSAGLTIDGGAGANRIFSVSSGKGLALFGLTLTGGNGDGATQSDSGGAIRNAGTTTLDRCTLAGNSAIFGGAIYNQSTMTLNRCVFTGNSVSGPFGGQGGAIYNLATMTLTQCTLSGGNTGGRGGAIYSETSPDFVTTSTRLTNCTVSGNTASSHGGGIYNQGGRTTLTHCTLSGNSAVAAQGSGVFSVGDTDTETVVVNSIIAGNVNSDVDFFFGPGNNSFTSQGHNLVGSGNATGDFDQTGDVINQTAASINLTPLGSNGGPTQTMVPRYGSPAIDAASFIAAVTTDQRGFPRPLENGPTGELPDIGAVEFQTAVVTTAADQLDTPTGAQTSLREALRDAADRVVFSPALAFQEVVLGSQLSVAKYVKIDASSVANGIIPSGMIVSANGVSRVFHIAPGVSADFIRLFITSGYAATNGFPNGYGGGIYVEGALTLTECTLSGNGAYVGAGAFVANSATASLTLDRSTVVGNGADYGGGIQNEGTLVCQSSTFAENVGSVEGGAINAPFAKPVSLKHCTISKNSAATGGGVAGNALSIQNSIVSGNAASSQPNLFGSSAQTGVNFIGGSVLLAPLGHYGGPTQTMALLPGSPARDSAPSFVPATDQRGFPIIGTPDIGAYEAGTFTHYNAWIWETLLTAGNGTITDPLHASTFDYDGDGVINGNEWPARTNPGDNSSYLRITQTALNSGNIQLTFPTVVGRNYTVEFTENLAPASWTPYGGILPGTGSPQTTPPIGPVGGYSHLFFRIRVGP